MLDPIIIETCKMAAHFLIPLILMIVFKQLRMPILVALLLSFSFVSAKEILDIQAIHLVEYDDLTINALGTVIGALV